MILAGVDEAGRGCVLGPLVVAGVSLEDSSIPRLIEMGIRDSKKLSPRRRAELYKHIKRVATGISIWKINPRKIDKVVSRGEKLFKLNYLEARYMALALARLHWDIAYLDCCDVNEERYGKMVEGFLFSKFQERRGKRELKSEHHADKNHPVVSAASIVAKVVRDRHIAKLQTKHGAFGSGYPADEETVEYLREFFKREERFPQFTRLSWSTVKKLSQQHEQLVNFKEFLSSERGASAL
jgi:ribonuclease HII